MLPPLLDHLGVRSLTSFAPILIESRDYSVTKFLDHLGALMVSASDTATFRTLPRVRTSQEMTCSPIIRYQIRREAVNDHSPNIRVNERGFLENGEDLRDLRLLGAEGESLLSYQTFALAMSSSAPRRSWR